MALLLILDQAKAGPSLRRSHRPVPTDLFLVRHLSMDVVADFPLL